MSINMEFPYPVPPFFYLLHASVYCQKALTTYIKLWKEKNEESKISVHKKLIFEEYGIASRKFHQDLLCLVDQGLANVDETPTKFNIELTDWEKMIE